jgi:hypothetical protein
MLTHRLAGTAATGAGGGAGAATGAGGGGAAGSGGGGTQANNTLDSRTTAIFPFIDGSVVKSPHAAGMKDAKI